MENLENLEALFPRNPGGKYNKIAETNVVSVGGEKVKTDIQPCNAFQKAFVKSNCKNIILMGGRGGGKTTAIILKCKHLAFKTHYHAGHYLATDPLLCRILITRQSNDELNKLAQEFVKHLGHLGQMRPNATFEFTHPHFQGTQIDFRYLTDARSLARHQGMQYNWVCIDEVENISKPEIVEDIVVSVRSGIGIPALQYGVCLAGNPSGPLFHWLKEKYWIHWTKDQGLDPDEAISVEDIRKLEDPYRIFRVKTSHEDDEIEKYEDRQYFWSNVDDNPYFDQDYKDSVFNRTRSDPVKHAGWYAGIFSHDIGAFFGKTWNRKIHFKRKLGGILPEEGWKCYRAYDPSGGASPAAVGWVAVCPKGGRKISFEEKGKIVKKWIPEGSMVIHRELWVADPTDPEVGADMSEAEIARNAKEIEVSMELPIEAGPADTGVEFFEYKNRKRKIDAWRERGMDFVKAKKVGRTHGRVAGWQLIREYLDNAYYDRRDAPHLYVNGDHCPHAGRTIDMLNRNPSNPDDVLKCPSDHFWELIRYLLTWNKEKMEDKKVISWGSRTHGMIGGR